MKLYTAPLNLCESKLKTQEYTIMINTNSKNIIRQLKNLDVGELNNYCIPITKNVTEIIGFLKPVDTILKKDPSVVDALTRWRQKFMKYFLTQFQSNNLRTSLWLENAVMADDTRILFLIIDNMGKAIGNFGISNISLESAELDNLIRGEKGGDSQLIFFSEISLMQWIYEELKVENIYLNVFSNNVRTIALHESVGFKKEQIQQLIKKEAKEEICYQLSGKLISESDELGLVKMRIDRNYFLERHINLHVTSNKS